MKRNSVLLLGLGLAAALVLSIYALSPFLAIRELRAAARAGDRARLEQLVDFAAVRDNLKSQISAQLTQTLGATLKDDPLAAVGALLAPAITDRIIDRVVTPEGLVSIIEQGKAAELASQSPTPSHSAPHRMEATYGYDGLDHFEVRLRRPDDPGVSVGLQLTRRGLAGWQVTRIDLSNLLSALGGAQGGPAKPAPR